VIRLTIGAKLAGVVGLLLLIVAAYLLLVPLEKPTTSGQPFRCGTAADPADGEFAHGVCQAQVRKYRLAALAFAAGSLVVAFGAGSAFGLDRRREKRSISGAD
jgi:hypothetical protein